MIVEQNKVVTFHYTLTTAAGDFTESSTTGEPVAFIPGHNNILPALEAAMLGKSEGETVEATLEPRDAYGERRENAMQRVPIKHLMQKGKLSPGMTVKVNTADGHRDATIIKVGRFNVDLDTNHPLAGKKLNFHIVIQAIRDATEEEISHGHAHGVGGHHH